MAAAAEERISDLRILGLICPGHFLSHYYQLALPPLFAAIRADIDIGFVALGAAISLYHIATAVLQTPVGFLVDRIGARWVLIGGLLLNGLAIAAVGFADGYWHILLAVTLAGIGNSVFHPADFAIMSSSIDERRMGRAFSAHSLGGMLGFAAAPVTIQFLAGLWGWRAALIAVGLAGAAFAVVMIPGLVAAQGGRPRAAARPTLDYRSLLDAKILSFFAFFVLMAAAGSGLSTFSIVAFVEVYGADDALAGGVLSAFYLLTGVGIAAGGIVADRWGRPDAVLGISFAAAAVMLAGIATEWFPFWLVIAAFGLAGFFRGVVNPSRDVMVRAHTPRGADGTVYGFVTTGFNVGLGTAPILYGWILDLGSASSVFWIAALFTLLTIGIAAPAARGGRAAGPTLRPRPRHVGAIA